MAVITVGHHPELTKEQAQEVFAKHFAGKYVVRTFTGPLRDFAIDKNAFIAVAVKLDQTGSETKFVYSGRGAALLSEVAEVPVSDDDCGLDFTSDVAMILASNALAAEFRGKHPDTARSAPPRACKACKDCRSK